MGLPEMMAEGLAEVMPRLFLIFGVAFATYSFVFGLRVVLSLRATDVEDEDDRAVTQSRATPLVANETVEQTLARIESGLAVQQGDTVINLPKMPKWGGR